MSEAGEPWPPLPVTTVRLPPAPPVAVARRSRIEAPILVALARTMPIDGTPPLAALLLEPKAVMPPPCPPVATAVRLMVVLLDVTSIDESAVGPAAAEKPPAL